MMGLKTPVAFLVFNRPDTTTQVFAAIRAAQPETLLLVADGPRPERLGETDACARVRKIIGQVDWPCRVMQNYSDVNLGCKARVSSGLDWVFDQVEEAIVLEDDCLPHPDFFPFCQRMLDRYRHDERVMMIGGTNYLQDRLHIPESYLFSRYFAIWGWASWRRAWRHYDLTMKAWPRFRSEGQLAGFYADSYMKRHMTVVFDDAFNGRVSTWDTQWFFACLCNNGVSIVPRRNMISNIGTTGAHSDGCSANNFFPLFPSDPEPLVHPDHLFPNQLYDRRFFVEQFKTNAGKMAASMGRLVRRRLSRLAGGKRL